MSHRPASPSHPHVLRIHFGAGERPYLFWVATRADDKLRFKVLSKRDASRRLSVLVIEEAGRSRNILASRTLPGDLPSGWLVQWVALLERDLGVEFQCFDLRHIETPEAWKRVVRELGWSADAGVDPPLPAGDPTRSRAR